MTTEDPTKNTLTTAQELMNFSETVDSIIDLTEGTRRKLIANGYPEPEARRMTADLWAAIWRSAAS